MFRSTLADVRAALGLCPPGRDVPVRGVSIDSRTIRGGELFVGLKGSQTDGSRFVDEALRRGAAAAVCSLSESDDERLLTVSSPLNALHRLAAVHRSGMKAGLIAVTGSVGKTTTRRLIHGVLTAGGLRGRQSERNYNNFIGVPLTLLSVEPEDEFAVVEVASSAPGEVARLADLARPEWAVLTPTGSAHAASLGDDDAIRKEKRSLIETTNAAGFGTPDWLDKFEAPRFFVNAPVRDAEVEPAGLSFSFGANRWRTRLPGKHFADLAALAISVGVAFQLQSEDISKGLMSVDSKRGRGATITAGHVTIIDDTYNASPLSVAAAIRMLADRPTAGRRHLVFGDMLDLGEHSDRHHRQVGQVAAESSVDTLLTVGPAAAKAHKEWRPCGRPSQCVNNTREAIDAVMPWIDDGDVILVKGSRGMRMEQVVDGLAARLK